MLQLVYTINSQIKESLSAIDETRKDILLFPLSRKQELRLEWDSMQARINGLVKFVGEESLKNKTSLYEKKVLQFRTAFDNINYNWYSVKRPITLNSVTTIHNFFGGGGVTATGKEFTKILDYLVSGGDHPVIQSAVAYIEFVEIAPFRDGNKETAEFLPYLILYKYGFDFRGLLTLSDYWIRTPRMYLYAWQSCKKEGKLTKWLEYYCAALVEQLLQIKNTLNQLSFQTDKPSSFFDLTDRQKEILSILFNPEETITNKKVQKRFRVSQITASRDLSKLASLGLLFSRGKGRSVYYTRV